MSIIAYYVHVDGAQLQAVREQPALVWNINSDPKFAKAALFDIDKDYDVLAWLLSEKKRKEQVRQVANYQAIRRDIASGKSLDKAEFDRVEAEELERLGAKPEDTDALPTDAALEAIEGRGTPSQRDPKLNLGMGAARLFKPEEVKKLSAALNRVRDADLRRTFDRKTMAKLDVGGIGWLQEPDSVLDEFLIPAFHRLRAFYADAAKRGHYVFVVYQ
ncbi:DUF1877 family protein [Roseateles sp. DXS20W]|uniref:DUF1877 family protein n=1 Tax=Pelomonas lactea TaxID=3299030 RepID=A0ABW7GL23_9BURK